MARARRRARWDGLFPPIYVKTEGTAYLLALFHATFSVNNVNKRLANLIDWLRQERPGVVCLQELKVTDPEFPLSALERAGYSAVWRG